MTKAQIAICLIPLMAISLFAQGPPCTQTASDTSFPLDNNQHSLLSLDGSAVATYTVTRVVGPGVLNTDVDNTGKLMNWQTLVNNGVVSRFASVLLPYVGFVEGGPNDFDAILYLNGQEVVRYSNLTRIVNSRYPWTLAPDGICAAIETQYLRFAAKGGAAGVNKIGITVVPNPDIPFTPNPAGGTASPSNLSFQAMAPIVLVHGWNAGPWVWGPKPATGPCPANPDNDKDGGQNFVKGLIDASVPYDCHILIASQATNDQGAAAIRAQLSGVLSSFGTRHVHLIAHSKAGLFAREFLQMNALTDSQSQVGVLSLTTLDAPHHGSVLADTVVRFNAGRFGGAVDKFLAFVATVPGFLGSGANDMTVDEVRKFNDRYLQPPPQFRLSDASGNTFITTPFYYSTSADADINGDGVISGAEAAPYPALFGKFAYNVIARGRSVSVLEAMGLLTASVSSLSDPIKNDLLVPIFSARYLKFTEINSFVGLNGRNHQTVRCGQDLTICSLDVVPLVLQQIRSAENGQPTH